MSRTVEPRTNALEVVRAAVGGEDRVLVLGGSGWLGRTTLSLLWHAHGEAWMDTHVVATASKGRPIQILGCGRLRVVEQSSGFNPTIIVNCAFLTQDRRGLLGHDEYVARARRLTKDLLERTRALRPRKVVTFSSGAAVASLKYPDDMDANPYGVLKAAEEKAVAALGSALGVDTSICRIWAISGAHVQEPRKYALSDFVLQGLTTGRIAVKSRHPTIRQYSSADDVVSVALASSGLFDTGGVTVEMGDLATAVADATASRVNRPTFDAREPADDYRGDDRSYIQRLIAAELRPAGLEEQVESVVRGLHR